MERAGLSNIDFNMYNLNAEVAARVMLSYIPAIVDNKKLLVKRDTINGVTNQRMYDPLGITNNFVLAGSDGNRTFDLAQYNTSNWLTQYAIRGHGGSPAVEADLGLGTVWRFSDNPANAETVSAKLKKPENINNDGQPYIMLGWSTSDVNGLNCRWQIEYLWRNEDENMAAAADGTAVGNFTDSNIANGLVITKMRLSAMASDDFCLTVKISRRSDLVGDTLNGISVDLHGICLFFTADKLGDPLPV